MGLRSVLNKNVVHFIADRAQKKKTMDLDTLNEAKLWDKLEPMSHRDKFALGIVKLNLESHLRD